jgi:hypothetical protein
MGGPICWDQPHMKIMLCFEIKPRLQAEIISGHALIAQRRS